MAKQNIFDVLLKTINDVQSKNEANPREETANPSVFDLIKDKLGDLDTSTREKRASKGKSPESIFDLIKKQIEGARTENQKDPNTPTAPSSIFDRIIKKIEEKPKRQANTGLRRIVEEYNLDVSRLPREVIQQVRQKYVADQRNFDKQYANAIYDLIKRY
jgi:hypothetical protein